MSIHIVKCTYSEIYYTYSRIFIWFASNNRVYSKIYGGIHSEVYSRINRRVHDRVHSGVYDRVYDRVHNGVYGKQT